MPHSAELKRELRARIRAARARRTDAERATLSAELTARLIDLVGQHGARSLTCFLPTRGEPDTRGFLEWAREESIDTLLPAARDDGLLDWIRPSGEGTVTGLFGIEEPLGELVSPLAAHDVDLMLIPAAAIDHRGTRLGWGRGYFDRMLASMERTPPIYAVVFDDEIVDELPADPHDIAVSGVATPSRTVSFPKC